MDNRLGSTNDSSKSYTIDPHLSFGPVGCEAPTSPGKKCGETKTLQIMQEFNNMYETKMKQINAEAGGDCVQAKINFQQKWIRDLTEQNDMLVRVVEELELEAADRITMLEEKLQRTSKCACEVMESYNDFSLSLLEDFQKMDRMQSDVQNLLELIRRAKRKGKWDFADLKFYSFDLGEVMNDFSTDEDTPIKLTDQRDKLLKQKNKKIKELEEKLSNLANGGEAEEAFQFKNLSQQYSELKKSMMDMREALTVEVANKHDVILSLRRDVHVLEEQCRKADQQTHFKDDIIKELRKEIKQLKQEDEAANALGKLYGENLKLHREVKDMQVKLIEIRQEILVTHKFTKAVQTSPSIDHLVPTTRQNNLMHQVKDILDGVEKEKLLVLGVDREVRTMLKEMYSQEKLLLDQSDLIILLVHKLFVVYNALVHLEDKTRRFRNVPDDVVKRIGQLEDENVALKEGIEIARKDLQELQHRAEEYLKERDGYMVKHKESLEVIATLQKENNITRERLKVLQEEKDESIDSFHSALMMELEEYERKHRESVEKIDKLRIELEKTKADHKGSVDQIITLNNENRYQNQKIETLQAELRVKSEKPKTNTVSVTASVTSRNFASNTSPARNDKAISNIPVTRMTATSMDWYDSQIVGAKASVGVEAVPAMLSEKTSVSQIEEELIATKVHKKAKEVACNTIEDSPYRCKSLFDNEATPKRIIITKPENEPSKTPRSRSLSPAAPRNLRLEDDIGFITTSSPIPKRAGPSRNRESCIADVVHLQAIAVPPQIQEMTVTELSRSSKSRSPSPSGTTKKSKSTRRTPPDERVAIHSGNEFDEVLGHLSAKYVEATGLSDLDVSYVQSLFSSSPGSPSSRGKTWGTTTLTTSYTPDLEVEALPLFAKKSETTDYLSIMNTQRLEAVEVDSQDDLRIPRGNLIGASSSEEIQQIIQIEILDKAMIPRPERHVGMSGSFPRSPALSWEDSFANSESTASSTSGTQMAKATASIGVEVNSKLKPAIKHRPRSRSTSSATDDLQSVVHDLNESVSRIIMRSPNEKVSRQKIAQLEEQLRGVNKNIKLIRNKDEMIKIQNETLNIIQIELQAVKQKEHEVEAERKRRAQEVENLKLTIKEMEKALNNTQEKSQNLQKAVDLNMNTVNLLEASEEHLKTEVARQRVTIVNLQEALVSTKQQLEDVQQKFSQDVQDTYNMMNILMMNLQNAEEQCAHYNNQFINASNTVEYLRDVNLDLEVENFELARDLSLFESRILKYQQITRMKECLCGLKVEVRKLRQLKKHHELLIKFLKGELRQCGQELTALKIVLESEGASLVQENTVLTSMVRELEVFTQSLQAQLGVIEADLIREKKINRVQADHIEELQGIISAKNTDVNRYKDAYQDVKSKLDEAVSKNRTLHESIKDLKEHCNQVEMQQMLQAESDEICHGELDICLNSLQEVKFKLRTQYQQLVQKIQECKDLEAELKIQNNNADIYKKDLENTRIRYRDEAIELKRNIRELKEKLQVSEKKIEVLNEEVKEAQGMLVESAQHEVKSQQEFSSREQELSEKIHSAQAEEMRLLELASQLEQQIATMRDEILTRDQQLELTKANVLKIRNEQTTQLNAAQQEATGLKNELNLVIQKQSKLKADNEKLQEQVACLKNSIRLFDQRDQALAERLQSAMDEIAVLQGENRLLQDKNAQTSGEMACLKDMLQKKTESVVNLEMELMQAKANRKELCAESRNVVASVRAWLDEQKMINEHLKEKLHRKNLLIAKLQKEKELTESCKSVVCPTVKKQPKCYPQANNNPRNWSLGSRGSGSESPASSNESGQPVWYGTYDGETEYLTPDATPQRWIHRVESMTQELQRSNRYWMKKMNENEFTVTKDE